MAMNAVAQPAITDQASILPAGPKQGFTDLLEVPFPPEFTQGARNAVTTCLKVKPEEKVTLIADRSCLAIAASMAAELEKLGCHWTGFVLEELAHQRWRGDRIAEERFYYDPAQLAGRT